MTDRPDSVDLGRLLDDFIRTVVRANGMKQRDSRWRLNMGKTVGGSELAAVMGMNPYSSLRKVVDSKLRILNGEDDRGRGGEACWWGVLFEDVISSYVEIDLGSPVKGDEICIQAVEGHRNSPDGYIVARYYRDDSGRLQLWTTDTAIDATIEVPLLLEFKCPLTRRPTGGIPKYYLPQVWSGLAVSPVAFQGLFVDAVFRKCRLADLGDTPEYDTSYHSRDPARGCPVAWGLIGVYAPDLGAPIGVRLGWRGAEWAPGDPTDEDCDVALAAWQIRRSGPEQVVDLGGVDDGAFKRTLDLIDRGRFPVVRVAPCCADGRGYQFHAGREIERLRRGARPDYHLFGVLPWKLFEVDYVPVARRPGFIEEVLPLIQNVHRLVAEARAAKNPAGFLSGQIDARDDEAMVQDLFDVISDRSADH